ncbi:MAG: MYXO-CTERM sorting domain-containing protein, partial [Myxococcales bacterium]|nr:MYXO-CTERM sorting domain-containing protein [Myxococcales bacterium]
GQCNMVHTQFCSFGWQNSYQELLYLFGPSVPDTIAPAVSIVAPQDGAMIEGGDLELVISLQDDQSPAIITTNIVITSDALPEPVEADGVYAAPGELTFPINGLPAGTYAVQVDIQDESDNPASDEVSFTVLEEPPAGGESGGGTGSDDAADGESGAGDGGPGDGGTDAGGTDDAGLIDPSGPTSNGGCDCRSGGPRRGPSLALGLLVLAGLAGRRRRR